MAICVGITLIIILIYIKGYYLYLDLEKQALMSIPALNFKSNGSWSRMKPNMNYPPWQDGPDISTCEVRRMYPIPAISGSFRM